MLSHPQIGGSRPSGVLCPHFLRRQCCPDDRLNTSKPFILSVSFYFREQVSLYLLESTATAALNMGLMITILMIFECSVCS